MSEKWTVEKLFVDENSGNPFSRGPEEMRLWECVDGKEAYMVWRGYDERALREIVNSLRGRRPGITYCVEFPNRKGERDGVRIEKRKFEGGAKCLPNPKQRMLITLIENRWGATLNEKTYMRTNGRAKEFFMRSDKTMETVFAFDTWEEVAQMAYAR